MGTSVPYLSNEHRARVADVGGDDAVVADEDARARAAAPALGLAEARDVIDERLVRGVEARLEGLGEVAAVGGAVGDGTRGAFARAKLRDLFVEEREEVLAEVRARRGAAVTVHDARCGGEGGRKASGG
eukprot:13784-Pelagococcus_subviridis.AAC.1